MFFEGISLPTQKSKNILELRNSENHHNRSPEEYIIIQNKIKQEIVKL